MRHVILACDFLLQLRILQISIYFVDSHFVNGFLFTYRMFCIFGTRSLSEAAVVHKAAFLFALDAPFLPLVVFTHKRTRLCTSSLLLLDFRTYLKNLTSTLRYHMHSDWRRLNYPRRLYLQNNCGKLHFIMNALELLKGAINLLV